MLREVARQWHEMRATCGRGWDTLRHKAPGQVTFWVIALVVGAAAGFAAILFRFAIQRLQAALNRDQMAFNQASVGRTCEVLVERKGKLPGQWLGKSPWLQSVWFEGETAIGDLVTAELVEAGPNSLAGKLRERVAA